MLEFLALIDSGADSCVMSRSVAELLQLRLGDTEKTGGIGGDAEGNWSKFTFRIKAGREEHVFNNIKVFVLKDDLDVPVLLGRTPFFDYFEVSFVKNAKIKLKKVSSQR